MPDTQRPYVRSVTRVARGGREPAGAGICKRGSTPADGRGSEGSARLNCTEGTRVLVRAALRGGPDHLPLKPGDQSGFGTGSSQRTLALRGRGTVLSHVMVLFRVEPWLK